MKIIKIGAIWCPACLVTQKTWLKIKETNSLEFTELDYDFDTEEVSKYNVGNILPVFIFLDKNNQELTRLIGEQTIENIQNTIDKYHN